MFTNSETLFNHAAELQQAVDSQNAVRRHQIKRLLLSIAGYVAVVSVLLYAFVNYYPDSPIPHICAFGILGLVYAYWDVKQENRKHYKKEVVPWLLKLAAKAAGGADGSGIRYRAEFGVAYALYKANPLFKEGNEIRSKDCISGEVGGRKFSFYEAYYFYEFSSSKPRIRLTRFRGFTFTTECGCGSHAAAAVTTGGLHGKNSGMFHRVVLGDTPLASTFCVYATDVDWAKRLFTTQMQERIMYLSYKTKAVRDVALKILFRKNNMEVYLPSSSLHFQPKLFRKTTVEKVEADYVVLETLLGLV